jgi:hypothetical protein
MTLKRIASLVVAVAVALLLAPGLAGTARAQEAPYTAYGVGLNSGQVVAAFINGVECGSDAADSAGNWLISITSAAPCAPTAGAEITFTLDGQATTASETWKIGGAPADIANGVKLVVKAATPTPAAGPGTFAGTIGAHGIIPAVFNGGTVAQMVSAAGTGLNSMWIFNTGAAVGYTVGAPDFVNAAFLALFPNGTVPASQIVILVKS